MTSNHGNSVLEEEQPANSLLQCESALNFTDADVYFAKERYKLHQSSPEEGVKTEILRQYFSKKYGF